MQYFGFVVFIFRSSRRRCSLKKVSLKIWTPFIEFQAWGPQFYQKKTPVMVFPCKFYKIFESIFFAEHLRMTASTSSGFSPAQQTRFSAHFGKLDNAKMRLPSCNSIFFSIYNQKERPLQWWLCIFLHFLVIYQKKITFTLILTYLFNYLIAHSLYE